MDTDSVCHCRDSDSIGLRDSGDPPILEEYADAQEVAVRLLSMGSPVCREDEALLDPEQPHRHYRQLGNVCCWNTSGDVGRCQRP